MNEEEKMALKHIKVNLGIEKKQHKHIYKYILGLYDNNSIEIILSLIDKQQKEIENYQILKDDIEGHNVVYVDTPEFEEKYISKDKIREKIKDLEENNNGDNYSLTNVIMILKNLLGE